MNTRQSPVRRRLLLAAGAALIGTSTLAQQPWPAKTIRFIVPFSAGAVPTT